MARIYYWTNFWYLIRVGIYTSLYKLWMKTNNKSLYIDCLRIKGLVIFDTGKVSIWSGHCFWLLNTRWRTIQGWVDRGRPHLSIKDPIRPTVSISDKVVRTWKEPTIVNWKVVGGLNEEDITKYCTLTEKIKKGITEIIFR